MMLTSKGVKSDFKIIILLCYSKSVTHSVASNEVKGELTNFASRRKKEHLMGKFFIYIADIEFEETIVI